MAAPGGDWFSEYGSVLTTFVSAVISYFVSRFTANKIATRSACKKAVSEILERLDEIESTTEQLLLTNGSDPASHRLSRQINITDTRLGRRLTELFRAQPRRFSATALQPVPQNINRTRIELRQFVTDIQWVQPNRAAYLAHDPIFEELRERVEALRAAIRLQAEDMKLGDLQ
jgi:hypothetical protein